MSHLMVWRDDQVNTRPTSPFQTLKRHVSLFCASCLIVFLPTSALTQIVLTGTNYTQTFDSLASGLPTGWTVRTNATADNLGIEAGLTISPTSWDTAMGRFYNYASTHGNDGLPLTGSESSATQAAVTNRCLGIRQSAAFGDPGAALVLQISNTLGKANLALSFDLNVLFVNTRTSRWTLDFAVGNTPTNFVPWVSFTEAKSFGKNPKSFTFGSALDGKNENVWIRIVALEGSTGTGSRDSFGIDNVRLSYTSPVVSPRIFGWGGNYYGQIFPPPSLTNVAAIATGGSHSMALRSNGLVMAWGNDWYGQANVSPTLAGVRAIAAGGQHSMALRSNGTVLAWGYNGSGRTNVPSGLSGVRAIAAGGDHSMALRSNGTVVTWGYGFWGQTNVPSGLSGVRAIAAGGDHSLALRSNGTVVAWGYQYSGVTNVPPGLSDVSAIAAGRFHSLALRSNGTVVAWGSNTQWQTNVPSNLVDVMAVAAGGDHSMALRSNGTLVAWGDSGYGLTNVPVGLSNVIAIAVSYHSLALTLNLPSRPLNDAISNAVVITGTLAVVTGSNVNASTEPGEPSHADGYGTKSVWWKWTAPINARINVDTTGSSLVPLLAIYTGSDQGDVYSLNPVASHWGGTGYSRIEAVQVTAGSTYYIAVDGNHGAEGDILLTLEMIPPPPNDNFEDRIAFGGVPVSTTGVNVDATKEPGEPNHVGYAGGKSVWWSWTAPYSGKFVVDTIGSTFNTLLAVYSGSTVDALDLIAQDDQSGGNSTSLLRFDAQAGERYEIAVDGWAGYSGQISLRISECPPPVIQLPYSVTQRTTTNGVEIEFCAQVSGSGLGPFEWFVDQGNPVSAPYKSGNCFYVVVDPADETEVIVRMTVTNLCGFDGQPSGPVTTCSICLSRGSPSLLSAATTYATGNGLTVSTTNCGSVSANARWYPLVVTNGGGMITVSTEGSPTDTLIAVYTGSRASSLTLTNIACNENASTNVTVASLQSRVSFMAKQGERYWIAVDPRTNNVPTLWVTSGFEPQIESVVLMPDRSFELRSGKAPAIPYKLQMATNLTTTPIYWTTVLTTNLSTNYPYLYYRDTNTQNRPQQFYRIPPPGQ